MNPLLQLSNVEKAYPGVRALAGVSFDLLPGEVHALLGENGAGKSTLIKVLAGAVTPDAGTVAVNGSPLPPGSPAAARRAGVAVIYQEFTLVPGLSAAANVFLGREGFVPNRRDEERKAGELFARLGVRVAPTALVHSLSVAQKQAVEIAKALAADARVLVMDEPTAALTPSEADRLLDVVRGLRRDGIGIVYVSHRLDEIFAVADRITVLRDGKHVATRPAAGVTRDELIELMVGRSLAAEYPPRVPNLGEPRLVVSNLSGGIVKDVSFHVRRGEVLGVAGLVGAGRTEVARLIFGADAKSAGTVSLDGRELDIRSPRDAVRSGIVLLTEDRKHQGLILAQSALANFALPNLGLWSPLGWVDRRRERAAFDTASTAVKLKAANPHVRAGTLSGGNQQKLVLMKWLQRECEVVIFDEPTRGIDVGARYELYQLINDLAARGKAVLLISSDLGEVLGMADRVLVMHEGRVSGEIADARAAAAGDVLQLAVR